MVIGWSRRYQQPAADPVARQSSCEGERIKSRKDHKLLSKIKMVKRVNLVRVVHKYKCNSPTIHILKGKTIMLFTLVTRVAQK